MKTCTAPRIYGLPKIHKEGNPLRPICSSINAPGYTLCKFVSNILKGINSNSKYNVRDAIYFKNRIKNIEIEEDEIMVSFDVVNLFPNIPINLALNTIKDSWDRINALTNITLDLFMEILSFCIKDTRYFKYDDKFYEQRKGMPMGSPASPIMADIVMELLLDTTLANLNNKPKILTKYVDDLFVILKKADVDNTIKALNTFSGQLKFTVEEENNNVLPYLDSLVIKQGKKLKLDWYQKPTSSGRLINFHSKHPRSTIINTATNFINRVLEISDPEFHNTNIDKLKKILKRNDFPEGTTETLIRQAKTRQSTTIKDTVNPKIYKSTTYIPGLSERIKNSDTYNKDKFEMALKSHNTVNNLFSRTKSKIDKNDKINVVYKIPCEGDGSDICQKVYIGTTKNRLKTRISAHKSDQKATQKPIEQKTALAAHCTLNRHKPNFDKVEILAQEKIYSRRLFKEMLHIIDVPVEKRMNFKRDTDGCAHIYRNTIENFRNKSKRKTVDSRFRRTTDHPAQLN